MLGIVGVREEMRLVVEGRITLKANFRIKISEKGEKKLLLLLPSLKEAPTSILCVKSADIRGFC